MNDIASVLVANRGEIARRIFRTCRDLGLGTVAVYADPDAGAAHVAEADAAVRLPGAAAADTYLRAELIVEAAVRAGADAVHPGYGFGSENPALARAVLDAGLVWIGPAPAAMAAMGDKIEAKRLMAAAGVPVLAQLEPDDITSAELPVLVKAAAGGGGRGMRVVTEWAELPDALAQARAEAGAAFGDPTVFCEPYLAGAHHVEVQVLADGHGTIWAVGERECSIQRRHQKVIEETPSPLAERVAGLRARLFAAARSAARSIAYTGAGTVEFIADDHGRFFFLEMNTRLQVEHPVTECATGLDLVAAQLDIAGGGRLSPEPPSPPDPARYCLEARLYAEDPAAGWLPQSGRLHRLHFDPVDVEFAVGASPAGVRVDSVGTDGVVVSPHYDALLAKVISWAPTRAEAVQRLTTTLRRARVHGVVTNRELLVNALQHKAFLAGDTDTAFFERHGLEALSAPLVDPAGRALSAVAAALAADAAAIEARPALATVPSGWRNVVSAPQRARFTGGADEHEVAYRLTRDGLRVEGAPDVELIAAAPEAVTLSSGGVQRRFAVARYGSEVFVDSALGPVTLRAVPRFAEPGPAVAAGSLLAPMPGTVREVVAAVGDRVEAGQPLLWLEAMKMQHRVDAPAAGTVSDLPVRDGQPVEFGAVLAVVAPEQSTPSEPEESA